MTATSYAANGVQYKVIYISTKGPEDAKKLEDALNREGKKDWRLITRDGPLFIFSK
jgi:hypothetical protein